MTKTNAINKTPTMAPPKTSLESADFEEHEVPPCVAESDKLKTTKRQLERHIYEVTDFSISCGWGDERLSNTTQRWGSR